MKAKPMAEYDYRAIDDLIHSRVRLMIMSFLAAARSTDFTALKKQLQVSDGNLSTHLSKLESVDYVVQTKQFSGKKPLTTVAITEKGDNAFKAYVESLAATIGMNDG
jgi:DNA-binding HxlR family transcriptional regulator